MAETGRTSRTEGPSTCGKGLAEHASLPAKMAEFLDALAKNLEAHVPTIDTRDVNGREEREAYVHLATEYAAIAARLAATAEEMSGCRNLPPARHHEEALSDPKLVEAFERFVALQIELADAVRASAERDGQLLHRSQPPGE